jgi:CcmD family protein
MKRTVLVLLVLALLPGVALMARQPAPAVRPPAPADPTAQMTASQPAPERVVPQDFVPVASLPPQAEQLPAAPLVIGAYAFVWVSLLAYVWMLWTRMKKLERELADLQRRVQTQETRRGSA